MFGQKDEGRAKQRGQKQVNERADLDVEIGRRGIVRAAPDRKASQSAYSASFSPFPSAICSPASFSPSVSSSSKGLRVVSVDSQCKRVRKKALRADDVRVEIKSLWKILTFLFDVAISNANYKNRTLMASSAREPRADVRLRGRDYAI